MSRIKSIFDKRLTDGKKVNIAYITPDYPFDDLTVDLTLMLVNNNVQIIEIGVPFSDPLADGPIIQNSSYKALLRNITIDKIISDVKKIRKQTDAGVVLMTYINPVLAYGKENFFRDAKEAGVDGLIIPDLPVDEIDFISEDVTLFGLDLILLAAPTSPFERLKKIASHSRGFIYCVSVTGVTGIRKTNYIENETITFLEQIKAVSKLPIAVGFGLSKFEQLKKIWPYTDGFIIGSALINSMEQAITKEEAINSAQKFIRNIYTD